MVKTKYRARRTGLEGLAIRDVAPPVESPLSKESQKAYNSLKGKKPQGLTQMQWETYVRVSLMCRNGRVRDKKVEDEEKLRKRTTSTRNLTNDQPHAGKCQEFTKADESVNGIRADDITKEGPERKESTHVNDVSEYKEFSGTHTLKNQIEASTITPEYLTNTPLSSKHMA